MRGHETWGAGWVFAGGSFTQRRGIAPFCLCGIWNGFGVEVSDHAITCVRIVNQTHFEGLLLDCLPDGGKIGFIWREFAQSNNLLAEVRYDVCAKCECLGRIGMFYKQASTLAQQHLAKSFF